VSDELTKRIIERSLVPDEMILTRVGGNSLITMNIERLVSDVMFADPVQVDELIDSTESHIRRAIELEFIKSPRHSLLELLGPGRKEYWESVDWGQGDFVGDGGKHSGRAAAMFAEIATIRSERRPHRGDDRITDRTSISQSEWEHLLEPKTVSVLGTGVALNQGVRRIHHPRMMPEPAQALQQMKTAAALDGIPLEAESIFRSSDEALRGAGGRNNSAAVAAMSSHLLGGTIDFTLGPSRLPFSVSQETSTSDMHRYVFEYYYSPVAKWLFLYSEEYGFHIFRNEPWHFEYNPEGYRERFQEHVPGL
jgi:hypothetical protein